MDSRRRQATSRIRPVRALRGFALALVLLAAETFAVVHPVDLAAHSNGEPCKICVSVAGVGTGTVAQPFVFTVDAAPPALAAEPSLVVVAAQRVRPTARGPPLAS
jgi:hypothetical protein